MIIDYENSEIMLLFAASAVSFVFIYFAFELGFKKVSTDDMQKIRGLFWSTSELQRRKASANEM